jgi:hypothetical protein
MKITLLVMIQCFNNGFELPEGKLSKTAAIPGTVMSKGELKNSAGDEIQSTYQSVVRKLLHMENYCI